MTPAETEPYSPNGEPSAYASLPCWTAAGLPSVAGTRFAGGCGRGRPRCRSRAASPTISPGDVEPSANVSSIVGRAVDDVEAREDVAGEVDDDAAAEAVVLVLVGGRWVRDALGLDEDERRLDGLVDELGEGRRRRHRGEGAGDGLVDLALGERRASSGRGAGSATSTRTSMTAAPMPYGARRRSRDARSRGGRRRSGVWGRGSLGHRQGLAGRRLDAPDEP